jgi:hypothetical protein
LLTGPVVANQLWQQLQGLWRKHVSEILGERCHNQFRVICADIKEVKTVFKGFTQTWRWISFSSCLTMPDCTPVCAQGRQFLMMGWTVMAHPPYSPSLVPSGILLACWRKHSEDAILWTVMILTTACMKSCDVSANSFTWPAYSVSQKGGKKCVVNEGELVE